MSIGSRGTADRVVIGSLVIAAGLWLAGCGLGPAADPATELARGKQALLAQPVDAVGAQGHLQRAAEMGSAAAAYHLGLLLRRGGPGVQVNLPQAGRWMRQAAEAGLPDAEFMLGQMMAAREIDGADMTEARQWLERAAEHDHPEANLALALAVRTGQLGYSVGALEGERFLMEAEHALKHRPPKP